MKFKRVLSAVLALVMVLGTMGTVVFAETAAKIGDVEYESFNAAWAAALQKSGNQTITLMNDDVYSGFSGNVTLSTKNFVVDLNGHTLTLEKDWYIVDVFYGGNTLEIKDSIGTGRIIFTNNAQIIFDADGKDTLTITDGEFINQNESVAMFKVGRWSAPDIKFDGGSYAGKVLEANSRANVTIGANVDGIDVLADGSVTGTQCAVISNSDGINSYATLSAAVDAANDSDVIEMVCDTTENIVKIKGDKDITIDLNGYTFYGSLNVNDEGALAVADCGTVTVTNGSISTVITEAGIESWGNIVLKDLNIKGNKKHAVRIKAGTALIDGGVYELDTEELKTTYNDSSVYAVYINGESYVTIEDGTFIGTDRTVLNAAGTKPSNDATVVRHDGSGSLTINGGDFSGGYTIEGMPYTLGWSGSVVITIEGGSFEYIEGNESHSKPKTEWLGTTKALAVNADKTRYVVVDAAAQLNGKNYATIQEAVDAATAGDTITVYPGTYDAFAILEGKDGITVKAADENNKPVIKTLYKDSPTWTRTYKGGVAPCGGIEIQAADVTLENLKLESYGYQNGRWYAAPLGTDNEKNVDKNGITVKNCDFTFVGGEGDFDAYAICLSGVTEITVTGCTFKNFKSGIYNEGTYAKGDDTQINYVITNNTFDVKDEAITVTPYYVEGVEPGTVTFTENTVVNGSVTVWDYGVSKQKNAAIDEIIIDTAKIEVILNSIDEENTKISLENTTATMIYTVADIKGEEPEDKTARAIALGEEFAKVGTTFYVNYESTNEEYPEEIYTKTAEGLISREINLIVDPSEEIKAGDKVKVDVQLNGVDIINAKWKITYDTEKFEAPEYDKKSVKDIEVDKEAGTIEVETYVEGDTPYDTESILATFTFTAKAYLIEKGVNDTADFVISDTYAQTLSEAKDGKDMKTGNNGTTTVAFEAIIRDVIVRLDNAELEAEDLTYDEEKDVYIINDEIAYDGELHTLDVVTDPLSDVVLSYTYQAPDAEEAVDIADPNFKAEGIYTITATIPAEEGYAGETRTYVLTIGKPDIKVEVNLKKVYYADYVAGKKLVLVYTDAKDVCFTYDSKVMVDVSSRGYKYNDVEEYEYVYAIVVDAIAEAESVDPYKKLVEPMYSTDKLYSLVDYTNDINFDSKINYNDISTIYGIYKANDVMFENIADMKKVLRADTNGDKYVNGVDINSVVSEVYGDK